MKILYIVDTDIDQISGVASKVCMQAKIWEEEGNEVIILSAYSLSFFNLDGKRLSDAKIQRRNKGKLSFLINAYKSSIFLKFLIKEIDFDVVYTRYKIYDPFFKSAVKHKPIIAEMNTVLETETKLRSLILYMYYSFFKKISFSTIEGFVCVSKEINIQTFKNKYKSVIIANGIDVNNFILENSRKNVKPKLVFIGTPGQIWQGFDKVVYLSSKLKSFDFHIIGRSGDNTNNLFYHGYLSQKESISILKTADVGICTLALHRKSMKEASPLKSRQYLALGLPIVYAYDDTDINQEYDFALKLPNTEENVKNNIAEIQNFVNNVFNNDSIRSLAKKFAKLHLDAKGKEIKRLQFMQQILSDNK